MLNKINIIVIGATGYTGLDLIKLYQIIQSKILYLCATKNLEKNFFDKDKEKLPKISS